MGDDEWDLDQLLNAEQEEAVEEEKIIIPKKKVTPPEYVASLLRGSGELVGVPLERLVVRSMHRNSTISFEESIAAILCSHSLRRRGYTVSLRSSLDDGLQELLKASDAIAKQWAPLLAVAGVEKELPRNKHKHHHLVDPYTLQGSIPLVAVSTAIAHLLSETPDLTYRVRTQSQLADAMYISQVLPTLPLEKAVYIREMLAHHRIADTASIALFAYVQERVPALLSLTLPEIHARYYAIKSKQRTIDQDTRDLVAKLRETKSGQQIVTDVFGNIERETGYILLPVAITDEPPEQYVARVLQNVQLFKVIPEGIVEINRFARTRLTLTRYGRGYDLTEIPPGTIGRLNRDGDFVPLTRNSRSRSYYSLARDELERLEEIVVNTGLVSGARIEIVQNLGPQRGYGPRHYYYNGTIDQVPVYTKGILIEDETPNKVRAQLDNGERWALHPHEIVLEKPIEKDVTAVTAVRTLLTERLPIALRQSQIDLEHQVEKALHVYEAAGIDRRIGAVVLYEEIENAEVRKTLSKLLPFSEISAGLTSGTYEQRALMLRKAIADATGHYLLLPTKPETSSEFDAFLNTLPEQLAKYAFARTDAPKPVSRGDIVAIEHNGNLQMGVYYRGCGSGHHMYLEAHDTGENHFNGTLIYGFVGGPRFPQTGARVKFKKRLLRPADERIGTVFFSRGEKTALIYFADNGDINRYEIDRIEDALPPREEIAGIQNTVAEIVKKYNVGEQQALVLTQQTVSSLLLLGYKPSKVREMFEHHLSERHISYLRERRIV